MDNNQPKRPRGRPRTRGLATTTTTPTPPAPTQGTTPSPLYEQKTYDPRGYNLPQLNFDKSIPPGETQKLLGNVLRRWDLPKIDISDANQVRERLKLYFQMCMEDDVRPTVTGMRNALGVGNHALERWKKGQRKTLPEHQQLILKAYDLMEELWEGYMLSGKVNPVAGIFLGKTLFGYREEQTININPHNAEEYAETRQAIEEKYKDLEVVIDSLDE